MTRYLKTTLLWVVTPAPEKTGRFYPEVANLLLATVEETVSIWRLQRVLGGLRRLLLGGGHRFLLFLLRLEVLEHRPEVAQLKLRDLDTVLLLRDMNG